MPRYIDADKLCEALMTRWKTADKNGEKLISEVMAYVVTPIIAGTPTADVVERKKGKWIDSAHYCVCDQCGHAQQQFTGIDGYFNQIPLHTSFCATCGADMSEEKADG